MYHLRIVCELPTSCCLRFFAPSLASDIHAFAPLCRSLGLFPTIPSLIRVYVVCCSPFVLAFLNQNRHSKCLLCVHAYYSLSLSIPLSIPCPALQDFCRTYVSPSTLSSCRFNWSSPRLLLGRNSNCLSCVLLLAPSPPFPYIPWGWPFGSFLSSNVAFTLRGQTDGSVAFVWTCCPYCPKLLTYIYPCLWQHIAPTTSLPSQYYILPIILALLLF